MMLSQHTNSIVETPSSRTFFNLIQKAGSKGRYQYYTFALWCIVNYIKGGLILGSAFLFYQDQYDCKALVLTTSCKDFVCSLLPTQRQFYIPSQPLMNSIANHYGDYRCNSQSNELNFLIFIMYLGHVIGQIVSALIGDLFGRKTLMIGSLAISVIGLVTAALSPTIILNIIFMFVTIFGVSIAFNLCFYFLAETVSQQYRQKFSSAVQILFGFGALLNVVWFYFIKDYFYVLIFCYAFPALFVLVMVFFFVKDTPICLVTRKTPQNILKDMVFIAKINKIETYPVSIEEITKIKSTYLQTATQQHAQKGRVFSIIDLFRYKSLRLMTVILIIITSILKFLYFIPIIMSDVIDFNIFIYFLIIQSAQFIAYIISYFIISIVKRRTTAFICYTICLLSSVVLIFFWNQDAQKGSTTTAQITVTLVMTCVSYFILTVQFTIFYVYFNQLYPTQVRVLGTNLVSGVGGLVLSYSYAIVDFIIQSGFPVMIVFAILSGICILCSFALPQTYKIVPQQIIEELKDQKQPESPQSSLLNGSSKSSKFEKKISQNQKSLMKNEKVS